MTERIYYTDAYAREFHARVVETADDGRRVYLDRTAFYPASGGQPSDTGLIGGVPVIDVIDEGERIAHRVATGVESTEVTCGIDWPHRFDHMQQHSGQHLLSAVFSELCGLATVSFHLGEESSTIDLDAPSLSPAQVLAVERRANDAVFENHPIRVSFHEAAEAPELRKPSERDGVLRIITIEGLDRSACGGTHLRATGEIGPVLIRKLDRVRDTVRVEFLCGRRAVRRARADYDALTRVAQMFSSPLDEAAAMVATQLETAHENERQARKLASELAQYRGRELYETVQPDASGMKRVTRQLAAGTLEELRGLAQSFTAQPKAVFLGVLENPPSLLLAASADSGIDAGRRLKEAVAAAGGRGGGNARIAQGSVPSKELLDAVLSRLA